VREKKDIRLFFALWPDEALRQRLQAAAITIPIEAGGRRVPGANLHLTLHFIGNVYFEQMECLKAAARSVNAPGFDLTLDVQGFFKKPRVAWLGCDNPSAALGDLHWQLGKRLQTCDFHPEARPYHPHVTVARKSGSIAANACFAPVEWSVSRFALIEVQAIKAKSITKGVQYRAVETYPLNLLT
jgi:2'-5' RNA ligase